MGFAWTIWEIRIHFVITLREGKSIIHKKNLENHNMIIKATNKIGQLFSNS